MESMGTKGLSEKVTGVTPFRGISVKSVATDCKILETGPVTVNTATKIRTQLG